MPKGIYLTIDDSPSDSFHEKVSFLKSRKVPAIFFCEGARMEDRLPAVRNAISSGYVIGNHAYSHPHFSTLSVEEGIREINRTADLIAQAYHSCGISRYPRLFRFPYGDKGDNLFGNHLYPFKSAYLRGVRQHSRSAYHWLRLLPDRVTRRYYAGKEKEGAARYESLQNYLVKEGYEKPAFPIHHPIYRSFSDDTDWMWTFDAEEYLYRKQPDSPESFKRIRERLEADDPVNAFSPQGSARGLLSHEDDILLMHDHVETDTLFYRTIDYLIQRGVVFLDPLSAH
jgi:peptidoglycan/xylan/chitin deacetylase (PgdA/CDA1 family)